MIGKVTTTTTTMIIDDTIDDNSVVMKLRHCLCHSITCSTSRSDTSATRVLTSWFPNTNALFQTIISSLLPTPSPHTRALAIKRTLTLTGLNFIEKPVTKQTMIL